MSKQEKIREGVDILLVNFALKKKSLLDAEDKAHLKSDIFKYLHSQGVVIKVEDNSFVAECLRDSWEEIKQDMKEAGYEATESLI